MFFKLCFPYIKFYWKHSRSKKTSRRWDEPLGLDRLAKVQNSAKSAHLGQCWSKMYVLCVQTKFCPQMYAESCDQSCSIGIKISKWNGGDLANKASYVWMKLMFAWRKAAGQGELCASLFPISGRHSYWLWGEKSENHAPIWNLWVYMGILLFLF